MNLPWSQTVTVGWSTKLNWCMISVAWCHTWLMDFLQVLSQEFGHRSEATRKIWTSRCNLRNFSPTLILRGRIYLETYCDMCDNHVSTLKANPHALNTSKPMDPCIIFTYIYHKNQPNVGKIYHTWILWEMASIFFPWVNLRVEHPSKGAFFCCENKPWGDVAKSELKDACLGFRNPVNSLVEGTVVEISFTTGLIYIPWKINGWNLPITHLEKENDLSNLHEYVPC